MNKEISNSKFLPVLFGFFIMGFVDVVGISTSYVKQDFTLSDTLANLLPMMVFLWFAVFSVPTGLMMNRLGRKNTVLISMVITFAAMVIPLLSYKFPFLLLAFALLGIGNTILQVSLNPLLTNVVRSNRVTSSLTLGQFIKAIASFLGPIIAGVAVTYFGNWKYIFPIFGFVTLLSSVWLLLVPIEEDQPKLLTSSFADCFGLLKNRFILMMFFGILCLVGVDVGLNTTLPKLLMERCHIPLDKAGLGTSLYFAARILGTLAGSIVLAKISNRRFLIINMILALVAMLFMFILGSLWSISILIFILGFTIANVFSIIFSMALQEMPDRANEISGLMIMGVSGGAIFPVLMGLVSDSIGTQTSGLLVLCVSIAYLLLIAVRPKPLNVV
jgi:MFS transporter, FHS family, L-fucose permease